MSIYIFLAVLVVLTGAYIAMRNGLVAAEQQVNAGWSGIEVQLKRRHDLIPSLVKAVKSAQTHERGIVDGILKAREAAMAALARRDVAGVSAAEAAISDGLRNFISYAEDNPEITATGNINTLQRQIEDTEDQISAARRFYNATTAQYNALIASIPHKFIATQLNLAQRRMIEFTPAETVAINAVPELAL
jgi:LemA protein